MENEQITKQADNNLKKSKAKNRQPKEIKVTRGFIVLMLLASLGSGYVGSSFNNNQTSSGNTETKIVEKTITSESKLINSLAKEVGQSVVSVNVKQTTSVQSFFGTRNSVQSGAGTGVILSENGIVITNRHVVPEGTTDVSVVLSDGTELEDVEVIGRTSDNDTLDVAFLRINDKKGKTLKAAKIGTSSVMEVGDQVVAIGNTLGEFQNTVTTGIISGFNRSIVASGSSGESAEQLSNLLQTDAAINEGNSGGPLVNISGEVIGINVAIAGNAQNVGFSIPIDDIKGLIKSVSETGKFEKAYLGIRYATITDDYAYRYNLPVNRGAYIPPTDDGSSSILNDSPASKAGLKEKDIIIQIDDMKVDETNSLGSIVGRKSVGDKVRLKVLRSGQNVDIEATLEAAK